MLSFKIFNLITFFFGSTLQKYEKAGQPHRDCPTFLRGSIQVWGVAGQSTGSPP